MSDISKRVAGLSPEKRDLLLRRLQQQAAPARPAPTLPRIVPDPEGRHQPFPLSDIQQAYWVGRSGLFDLHSRGTTIYMAFEISGLEDQFTAIFQQRFEHAIGRMVERHDMLRAIILPDGRQQILPGVPPYRIALIDLRGCDPHAVEAELASFRERMCRQRRPLDRWPLFEIVAHQLDGRRMRLHIGIEALLLDGRSRTLFLQELFQLAGFPESAAPPLECSYRDYVLTWAAFRESELYQHAREHWLSRLPTLPPAPELPLSVNIDPSTPNWERECAFQLDLQTWQRLKARAAQSGLSPSGVALAAFVEVLTAWSRCPRFTIGLVGTYRPPLHPQIQDIIGNFQTLYLLPVENSRATFEARAMRLQEQTTTDLEQRYFSGFEVLRELNRLRGRSSRAALPIWFNSLLEYSHPSYRIASAATTTPPAPDAAPPLPAEQPAGLALDIREVAANLYGPQLLLAPTIREGASGELHCAWHAVEHVFPAGLMDDMMAAYQRLLRRLADDKQCWHQMARELVPPEQLERRAPTGDSAAPVPGELLHALFAAQVAQRPAQPAVIAAGRTLSYQELDRRSSQVAARLRELGAGPGALVAIALDHGWQQVVAVLGVLRSGAGYLPLDPRSPTVPPCDLPGQVTLALTHAALDAEPAWPPHIQRLHLDRLAPSGDAEIPIVPRQSPDDPAYISFTWDAGRPSAVLNAHRGTANTILAINCDFRVGPGDRVLALSPLTCDLSVYDIFGPLAAGATIVIPPSAATDPVGWAELIAREHVTVWNSPPALLELLVTHLERNPAQVPRTLRLAFLSRDWIPLALPDRLRALIAEIALVGLGGATEASIWSLAYPIAAVEPGWSSIPYGRPLGNQNAYVLDTSLESCPDWVPGHLYLGGPGLAPGYLGRPDLTAERFVPCPWSVVSRQLQRTTDYGPLTTDNRLYRTGDLARYLPDGTIELLGPAEQAQTTLYGYPVAPRQIEAALERHPAVRAVVVLAREDRPGERRLVAYVVPDQEQRSKNKEQKRETPDSQFSILNSQFTQELRQFLRERLPYYMQPAIVVLLEALPLTPHGAVDRRALPAPAATPPGAFVAPRDALERKLAELWESLLDTRQVGVTDHFYDLGGNSFLAVRLMALVQQQFAQTLPVHRFFFEATIEHLARMLRAQAGHAVDRIASQ